MSTIELDYDPTLDTYAALLAASGEECECHTARNDDGLCRPCRAREILNDAVRFEHGE